MKPNPLINKSPGGEVRNFYFDNRSLRINTGPEKININYNKLKLAVSKRRGIAEVVGDRLYVFGGQQGTANNSTANVKNTLEYDFINNVWNDKAPMDTNRDSSAGSAVVGDKIYILGGYNNTGYSDPLDRLRVDEYDTTLNIWTAKQQLPSARRDFDCVTIDNKIYAVGGEGTNAKIIEEYNPSTNTWLSKSVAMPTSSTVYTSVCIINNKIYATGNKSLIEYDLATNTWSSKSSLNQERYKPSVFILNDKIYTLGGGSIDIEEYDLTKNSWTIKGKVSLRAESATTVYNNKAYIIGGIVDSGYTYSPLISDILEVSIKPQAEVIIDYLKAGERIYSYQECKVGTQVIKPYKLTTILSSGYLYYTNSEDQLSGYILAKV